MGVEREERKEVLEWQEKTIEKAEFAGCVYTMFGRSRDLNNINSKNRRLRARARRAAINTPIQGSAADVVMAAMIALHENEELRKGVRLKDQKERPVHTCIVTPVKKKKSNLSKHIMIW